MDAHDEQDLLDMRRELAFETRRKERALRRQRLRTLMECDSGNLVALEQAPPELTPTSLDRELVSNWRAVHHRTSETKSREAHEVFDKKGGGSRQPGRLRKTQSSVPAFDKPCAALSPASGRRKSFAVSSNRGVTSVSEGGQPLPAEAGEQACHDNASAAFVQGGSPFSQIARVRSWTAVSKGDQSPDAPRHQQFCRSPNSTSPTAEKPRSHPGLSSHADLESCRRGLPSPNTFRCPLPRSPVRGPGQAPMRRQSRHTRTSLSADFDAASRGGEFDLQTGGYVRQQSLLSQSDVGRQCTEMCEDRQGGQGHVERRDTASESGAAVGVLYETLKDGGGSLSSWLTNIF